jgi:hypothetical protein
MQSAVLNTEGKTHAHDEQLVCPVTYEKKGTQKKQDLYEHGDR